MHFGFTDDQREIKDTARSLLADRTGWERVRAQAETGTHDDTLQRELSELGWPGIAIPEEWGGAGLGYVELAVLLEELGYALAPVPFLGTVSAAAVIGRGGSAEQRDRWLPRLASGELRGAAGAPELIPDGVGADVIVLLDVREAGLAGQGTVDAVATIDPTRRYARAVGHGMHETLGGDLREPLALAATLAAAELVGVAQRALDMTVEYVRERKQFGRPVGSFQAVAHRCAQMLLHVESARSAVYFAAWAADAADERLAEAAALAKATASDGARETTAGAIQLHGGVGFAWESDVHWLYKRAQLMAAHLGGGSHHRQTLGRLAAERSAAAV